MGEWEVGGETRVVVIRREPVNILTQRYGCRQPSFQPLTLRNGHRILKMVGEDGRWNLYRVQATGWNRRPAIPAGGEEECSLKMTLQSENFETAGRGDVQ